VSNQRYLHLDVFTDRPLTGNQLAVYPEPAGLDSETMQRIANEMAFPETTFVLPPDEAGTDARVRIFTPALEMPMAGHPTIGTTFALAHEGRIEAGRPGVVLGLGVGPTPIRLEWEGTRLKFAWMSQPDPVFGPMPADRPGLAAALGIESKDLVTELPPQEVSSGVPFLFVGLATRAAVDAVVLDRAGMARVYRAAGMAERPIFVFSLDRADDDATAYSRMFAPSFGIAEDPATGGASGPLGAYLVRHGAVGSERAGQILSLQGVKMGRPSRIHISVGRPSGAIGDLRVGGEAVVVGSGVLRV
jgi:trans-2,3-dihydro-3-hydroxyanthranilate isomerase